MKTSPRFILRPSFKVRSSFGHSKKLFRIRFPWLLLLAALPWTPLARAQVVGMQDKFTYTTSNINGHAPTTGTGVWAISAGGTASISTSGSQAVISVNGGIPGAGSIVASIPFTAGANTLYTLTTTFKYINTTGTADCWAGMGFSNAVNGAGNAPWALIRPQSSSSSNGGTALSSGTSWPWSGSVAAATYSSPIVATITWNTMTGVIQYYINNTLQATGTSIVPSGRYYAFFQGFQTGNAVNVKDITLTAQTLNLTSMQDSFNYTVSNINSHAPTVTPAGGVWTTNNSGGSSIAATGAQANIIVNSGTVGAGQATANYAFLPSPNSFYTLRIAYNFNGPVGAGKDCWTGFGFSNLNGTNIAPWMFIRPQGLSTDNPQTAFNANNTWMGSLNVPAAYYSAPITATITWDTSSGQAKYYINDLLQWTGTTPLPSGQFNAFFQGFQTGTAVSVQGITLTSQPLPLPFSYFVPPVFYTNDFAAMFDSGTGSAAWATARSHLTAIHVPAQFCTDWICSQFPPYYSDATVKSCLGWINTHNLQLVLASQYLTYTGTCAQGEGYTGLSYNQWLAARVSGTLGATVNDILMDEPLTNGHEAKCLLSISECANEVWQTIAVFRQIWPNATVSDCEALVGAVPLADVQPWITAYRNATGNPTHQSFASLEDDPDWRVPLSQRVPYANACAQSGVPYGMIFTGDSVSSSANEQWVQAALEAVQLYNASGLPIPNRVSFASWDPYPTGTNAILPESSPKTISYLVNYYYTSPYATQPPPVPLYRVYNFGGDTECFTSSPTERAAFLAAGWADFGIIGGIYPYQACARGLVPLCRYNKGSSYAFAITPAEQSDLINRGYAYQLIAGYVFPNTAPGSGGLVFYCCYNSNGNYWYGYDYSVYQGLITNNGYTGKGIECYIMPRWQP